MSKPSDSSLVQATVRLEPERAVRRGDILAIELTLTNTGEGDVFALPVKLAFPKGVAPIPKTATTNGRPARTVKYAQRSRQCTIVVPLIIAGHGCTVVCKAVVEEIETPGDPLICQALAGQSRLSAQLDTQSFIEFSSDENYVEAASSGKPGESVPFTIVLTNTGTMSARGAQLRVAAPHIAFEEPTARVASAFDVRTSVLSRILDLGDVRASEQRRITGMLTLPRLHDDTDVYMAPVSVCTDDSEECAIGTLTVDFRPDIVLNGSFLRDLGGEHPMYYGEQRSLVVTVANSGLTRATGVRAIFELPEDIELDEVRGARNESNALFFGDIDAGCTQSASIRIRFAEKKSEDETRVVKATIVAEGSESIELDPLHIPVNTTTLIPGSSTDTARRSEDVTTVETFAARLQSSINETRLPVMLRVVKQLCADDRLGWYRHELAVRVFLAEDLWIDDPAGTSMQAYRNLRTHLHRGLSHALLRLALPTFAVSPEWVTSFRDAEASRMLEAVLEQVRPYIGEPSKPEAFAHDVTLGALPLSRVEWALGERGNNKALWITATLPMLIPTLCRDIRLEEMLQEYAVSCIEFYGGLSAEDHADETMSTNNASLDQTLAQIAEVLEQHLVRDVAA